MQRFVEECRITAQTRVLDIGGTPDNWLLVPVQPRVVLLNMPRAQADLAGAVQWVAGDGRALPFRDAAFDVVFSNSVIEHVGDAASQQRFAHEVSRVGRTYWVQTPNRWFPVEQHLLTPIVHWLPKAWQSAIVTRFTVWSALTRPTSDRRDFYDYARGAALKHSRMKQRVAEEIKNLGNSCAVERPLSHAKKISSKNKPENR